MGRAGRSCVARPTAPAPKGEAWAASESIWVHNSCCLCGRMRLPPGCLKGAEGRFPASRCPNRRSCPARSATYSACLRITQHHTCRYKCQPVGGWNLNPALLQRQEFSKCTQLQPLPTDCGELGQACCPVGLYRANGTQGFFEPSSKFCWADDVCEFGACWGKQVMHHVDG